VQLKRPDGVVQEGQTHDCQVENLRDVLEELEMANNKHFRIQGGYTMAEDEGLALLNEKLGPRLKDEKQAESLRGLLRIGVHADVQVTSSNWAREQIRDEKQHKYLGQRAQFRTVETVTKHGKNLHAWCLTPHTKRLYGPPWKTR
jgi:hypothetical protein